MKVYTSTLTVEDLDLAAHRVAAPVFLRPGARLVDGRTRRFEGVRLGAHSHLRADGWRDGQYVPSRYGGASSLGANRLMPQHATYDEHGAWMALVFEADPEARIVSAVNRFEGRDDFHAQTDGRYEVKA